jgi:Fic family protein
MRYLESHPWITFSFDPLRLDSVTWVALGEIKSKCEHLAGVPLQPSIAQDLSQVYLAKGALATTAIEGNTLSEDEVKRHLEGKLKLPPSKEYLGKEIDNILEAFKVSDKKVFLEGKADISPDMILEYNRLVLADLDVGEDVKPGQIRMHSVGVGRYRGCPPEECSFLLEKLCSWLAEYKANAELRIPMAILKSIISHVYLAWIHPFGDGNGRTARLVEYHILLAGGVPHPAAQLLSNFYNETRQQYYRNLDRSSRSKGDITPFITYAVQGFLDGLREQIETIKEQHCRIAWKDYIHETFKGKNTNAETRRRHLALDLSRNNEFVPISKITELSPRIAKSYAKKGQKTLTRDVNRLVSLGLVEKRGNTIRSNSNKILAFLPLTLS